MQYGKSYVANNTGCVRADATIQTVLNFSFLNQIHVLADLYSHITKEKGRTNLQDTKINAYIQNYNGTALYSMSNSISKMLTPTVLGTILLKN